MSSSRSFSVQVSTSLILLFLTFVAQADVPLRNRLKFVNEGDYGLKGEYYTEYGADYRVLPLGTFPFFLCFFNTTPGGYKLGMLMGHLSNDDNLMIVWDANARNLVHENATVTLGADGNLVLAEADGLIVWQTDTANKGVEHMSLLPNGNLVLQDINGGIIWQSFYYPTNTLLVGQPLRSDGVNKIVSGAYSLVLGKNGVTLYLKSKNSPTPIPYFQLYGKNKKTFAFQSSPVSIGSNDYQLGFQLTASTDTTTFNITQTPYNSTLSFIQLETDGNIRIYTSDPDLQDYFWRNTYVVPDTYTGLASVCQLPATCGSLGICNNNSCVACPTPQGLTEWNQDTCKPPTLSCEVGGAVTYYKVVGVDHFSIETGDGRVTLNGCKKKCDKDCGCLAFFYRSKTSECLLVPELGTLTQVSDPSHVAYIKLSK